MLHKHGELLYDGVERTIGSKLLKTAQEVEKTTDNQLIEVVVEKWNNHKLTMTMIRDILMYMDKTYCEIKSKMVSYDLGIARFKSIVVMNSHVLGRLRTELLLSIRREREHEVIDQSLMRNCLRMFVDLDSPTSNAVNHHHHHSRESTHSHSHHSHKSHSHASQSHSASSTSSSTAPRELLYDIEFQKHFIRETREFYQVESEIYMTQNSVPEYLRKIEQRLLEEKERADSYIPKKYTRDLLMTTCEYELIGRYQDTLIDNKQSGCFHLFDAHRVDDLKRMYTLFQRIDVKNTLLQKCMYAYIKQRGESIVSDAENLKNPEKFVILVLNLRNKFETIVNDSFSGDKNFMRKLKEGFEYFLNLDVRSAQYLSLFTDTLLRRHAAKMSEQEVLCKLDDVITIFKYLSDKDIFEEFYKQQLASRLLHTKSHSDHFEKAMIAKLKTECGHQYTSKLEGMFKDIAQSRQIDEHWHALYDATQDADNADDTQLNCKVLTTGFWPITYGQGSGSGNALSLPPQLGSICEKFKSFYCNSHSGRKLVFDTSRGSAELRVQFESAAKDLVVHTYQMCILLLFNERDTYTFKEIAGALNIERSELERHILALAHPKVKVLHKRPNKKLLTESDTFTFNHKYKNQRVRIHIGVLDKSKEQKESEADHNNSSGHNGKHGGKDAHIPQQVLEARKNRVEAAIVRIMKARKKLHHQQLIVEVVHQLQARFNPDPQFIKQRIASLIEREYLERDSNDRRLYHYLA